MQHTQQLFLEALKAALKNEQVEWNNKLEAQEWMDLFRMAEVHQILPMIYEAVYRSPAAGQADPQILAPAKAQMVRTVIMQTQKTGEFEPLYRYLRESGICPLVVKGIVCRNIYPNPDYRISGDEDLLIRPEDFRKCHDLLREYGMQTSEQDMDAEELESVYEVPYGKKGSLIYIELHKSLFPPESEAYGDLNRFFANVHEDAIDIRIDGTDIRTMGYTDHLFYLICHSFKHFLHSGFGIRQVCDIILFANEYGDANAYSNLSSANTMAKTFEKILKSNIMEKKICEKLKVEELDADIHAKVLEGTNMLVLSVTADTPKESIDIIRTVMDNYSSVSLYTVGSAVMDVLEEPKIPYTPDNPLDAGGQAKKGGLVAGALVIILLGLFSYMKNTIKQENEIEKKLDARSLGAISYEWKYKTIRDIFRRKKKAILVDDPVASFRFVESYKKLAAKVEYRMAKNEQKVLVVTSVSENEGKSTVAANLAITLAEQSKRVLLVDGDIRRPSQFLIFGMEPKEENELGEYLRGNGSLADVMVPCTRKHMLFMGGKNCYSSSTEMLNSESFFKLMTACRKFVDYVIIDTPPAGIIGDAQIFAHCADAVMIVSRQNYMLAEDINEVMDAFRDKEGKVLGVVLNGVRSFSGLVDSPVGHYYGKYSKYGRYGNYGRSKGM